MMRKVLWLKSLLGGVIWAASYNAVWGVAWFGFMRHEWARAATSSGQAMPWTADFWMVWVPLTILFGIAIAAYLNAASQQERLFAASIAASFAIWVPGTLGMALSMPLSTRVILLDSAVNLVAVLLASLSVVWLVARRGKASARQPSSAAR